MTNLAGALKQEIARIARRTLRAEFEGLKAQNTRQRTQLGKLSRELAAVRKELTLLQRQAKMASRTAESSGDTNSKKLRFGAARFSAMRKKKGLSAPQLGRLLEVSAQTIYNWEAGKGRPNAAQLQAIAAVRRLGKRELAARMESSQQA